ncbi:hypothetical protein [Actinomycetospora sp. TBRC 11914]|uniref:hypothetical protein n=1 Tax=Actinomycetospora sp. TBRC 11914 TaxID=2729387 RepID=UPI00145DA7E4|nr:hypothetical protein [Actinomycetospora sp. TBRC 11914]NMO94089.1 hypothetical protein [Actinomycetospora sp. TBRC 11914]
MAEDRDAEMSVLHARVRDRVDRSRKLLTSVRHRAHDHRDRALSGFTAAERQLDRVAGGLPAVYRLAVPPDGGRTEDVLAVVLEAARSVYGGCEATSVTAMAHSATVGEHWPVTVAATGPAASLDAAQYGLGEGPLVDAVELHQVGTVHAADLEDDEVRGTWPRFGEIARRAGIRSALSIGLPWTDDARVPVAAAITLYSAETRTLSAPEARGLVLGSWAGAVLSGRKPAEVYDAIIWRPHHVPTDWYDEAPGSP